MSLTKEQLEALNNSSFPTNNAGYITADLLRNYNSSSIAAFVDENTYLVDSASFDSRIDNIVGGTAYVTTASFNAYTQSTNDTIAGLETTASFNQFSQSVSSQLNSLESATGSYVTSAITASSLITASVSQSTITFIKGDGTQFNIVVADNSGSTFDTGSLVTTASFNAYTASQDFKNTTFATTSSLNSVSTSVGLLQTFSGSQYKADSSSFDSRINAAGGQSQIQDEGTILGTATSLNFNGAGVTATISAGTASITIPGGGGSIYTGSFAVTSSNTFTGDQTINGAILPNTTNGLIKLYSQAFNSASVQYNITASNALTQSNLVFGGATLSSILTGSVIISGSNNILFNPSKSNLAINAFTVGYVNGVNNIIATLPQLSTGSLVNPSTNSNILYSPVQLNFITSSLTNPSFSSNLAYATFTINHQSGTFNASSNIINGAVTSNQNSLTSGTVAATFNNNIIGGGGLTLGHISSSILSTLNAIFGGTTIVNQYYQTGSNNSLTFGNNLTNGQTIAINAGGSPATNVSRTISNNLIGGQTITIQADVTGSDLGGVRNDIVYGYNLIVSGANSLAGAAQGGAFFGRYNDINNLYADSGKMVFAVGTGTGNSTRKTALSVDSASVVNVSGSLSVSGSVIVSSSVLNIDSSGNVTASKFLATTNAGGVPGAFAYNAPSSGTIANTFNTSLGRDFLDIYQYQGQPYAFAMHLTSDQLNTYTGSQFLFQLQKNGSGVSIPGGGATYFAMVSGSTIVPSGAGSTIPGLDVLGSAMCLDFKAPSTFEQLVYMNKNLYVSSSAGSSGAALTLNQQLGNTALLATGSVIITGSLNLNGNNIQYLAAGAFSSGQTQSGSSGVSQSMTFNNQDISNQGITISNNSQLTVSKGGTYDIEFSAQLLSTTGADDVYIWLKKNGTNVATTASRVVLANNDELVAAWNWVVTANAGDYFEIAWQSANGHATLLFEGATGNIPAIPSVIATVTQIN